MQLLEGPRVFGTIEEAKGYAREKHKILGLDLGILHNGRQYMVVNLTLSKRDIQYYVNRKTSRLVWCICAGIPKDHWIARNKEAYALLLRNRTNGG